MVFCSGMAFAQEEEKEEKKFQMYSVHEDHVIPSKVQDYEKAAKAVADKMRENNISGGDYLVTNTNTFRYLYVTPIEKMADLDSNIGFSELSKKIGNEAMGELFNKFDGTFSKHGDYVIWMDKELSYMPNGITQTPEGQNYRKFLYLYFNPGDGTKVRDGMKAVKELFAKKGSTSYYRVYRSGFGVMENYFMIAIAAKNAVEMEQGGADNDKLLGEDAFPVFTKVLEGTARMEEYTGYIRPELGYSSKKE